MSGFFEEPAVTLYHQGNLSSGVSDFRYLSTSTSSELLHYHPEGQLYRFEVPGETFRLWRAEGSARPLRDLHLPSGIYTDEWRIYPPAAGGMNKYLRKIIDASSKNWTGSLTSRNRYCEF